MNALCITIPAEYRPQINHDHDGVRIYIAGEVEREEIGRAFMEIGVSLMFSVAQARRERESSGA